MNKYCIFLLAPVFASTSISDMLRSLYGTTVPTKPPANPDTVCYYCQGKQIFKQLLSNSVYIKPFSIKL